MFSKLESKKIYLNLHSLSKSNAKIKFLFQISTLITKIIVKFDYVCNYLYEQFKIPHEKCEFIPHVDSKSRLYDKSIIKEDLGLTNKKVIFNYGILTESKGLEYIVAAVG